jgi:outer membrane protein
MRRTKRLVSAAIVMMGLLAAPASAQSLTDALIAAYRNSNLLEQNRAVLRAADEDVAIAVATLRPVVNFVARATASSAVRAGAGGVNVRSNDVSATLALSADLTLYDFGRGQIAIDAAKENVLAVRQALVGVEQRVLLSAVAAFMDVRSAAETVNLRENNVRLITQQLRATRDRFEVGEITRTDVAIAEARLAGARSNLAAAQGDLAVAREAYKAATGAYPGNALRSPPGLPRIPRTLEEAQAIARNTHPSIKQSQHEVTASELNLARAVAVRQGQISGSASLSVDDGGRDTSSLSLSYQRPLYTGGRQSAQERQAAARRDAARAALHQTAADVMQDVGRSWSDLAVAFARIEASDRQIEASQTAYDGVRQEAELGARTTLDVLNAEQELLDARTTRIAADTARYVAVYRLLSSMGLLTVEHLGLGIPTYDPEAYYNAVRNAPRTRSVQGDQLDRVLRSIGRE